MQGPAEKNAPKLALLIAGIGVAAVLLIILGVQRASCSWCRLRLLRGGGGSHLGGDIARIRRVAQALFGLLFGMLLNLDHKGYH